MTWQITISYILFLMSVKPLKTISVEIIAGSLSHVFWKCHDAWLRITPLSCCCQHFFFATLLLHNNIIYSFLSINILNSFSKEKRMFLQANFDNDWTILKNRPNSLFSPWGTCQNHSLQSVYFVLFLYPQLLLFTYWVTLENDKLILMCA